MKSFFGCQQLIDDAEDDESDGSGKNGCTEGNEAEAECGPNTDESSGKAVLVSANEGLVGRDFWSDGGELVGDPSFAGAGKESFGYPPDDGSEGEEGEWGGETRYEERNAGQEVAEGNAELAAVDIGDDSGGDFTEENSDLEYGSEDDELEVVEVGFFDKVDRHEGTDDGIDNPVGEEQGSIEFKRLDLGILLGLVGTGWK